MNKIIYLIVPLLFCSMAFYAQDSSETIEEQFTKVLDKSNSYQEYKVIKKTKLAMLRRNILDTITSLQTTIETATVKINNQSGQIDQLSQNLILIEGELKSSQKKENGIKIFGMLLHKHIYNGIMWTIVGGLLFSLIALYIKFKNGYSITKVAKVKLSETESEFESFRQKTLEKEQQFRRKLQDEINKNKK